MKLGKISENIMNRSVLKPIYNSIKEQKFSPGFGVDFAEVQAQGKMILSSGCPLCTNKRKGYYGIYEQVNDLAAAGATPVGVIVDILFPTRVREINLRKLMEEIQSTCEELDISVLGGNTQVTDEVNSPVLTVTALGYREEQCQVSSRGLKPGDDIVMTKWAGLQGSAILAEEYPDKLQETLPEYIIEEVLKYGQMISVLPESRIACENGATALHDVSQGGVFGALWEMGSASGVGVVVDLMKIPVKQETIEVTECFGMNPYKLLGGGSLLIGCPQGALMVDRLREAGIHAEVIGYATEGNDRIIKHDEEARFLEPAGSDEIFLAKTAES